jgi:hypothetical protein
VCTANVCRSPISARILDGAVLDRGLDATVESAGFSLVCVVTQTAIEAEATEFLGLERYAHGARARKGSGNGHCPTTVKTTTGLVTIDRPKLWGTDEALGLAAAWGGRVPHQRPGVPG